MLVLGNVALYLWASGIRVAPDLSLTAARPDLQARQLRLYMAPAAGEQKNTCLRVGPFIKKAKAVLSRTLLTTRGIQTLALETSTNRKIRAYRLYMGPYPSRQARSKTRDRLNQLGVNDQYMIRESNGDLLISLGLFTQLHGAKRYIQTLRSKGLEVSLREELRSLGGSYWLLLNALDEADIKRRDWSDPRARLHRVVCPDNISD